MQTQDLPCETCRRRKVKCSKAEPCSNCDKASIECIYKSADRSQPGATPSISDMAERITRLEETVEQMKHQLDSTTTTHALSHEPHVTKSGSSGVRPQGSLIRVADRSRYVEPSFWASAYINTPALGFLLRDELDPPDADILFQRSAYQQTQRHMLPTPAASDFLLKAYLTNVDPFMRIVHKPMLLAGFDHFRHGTLGNTSKREFGGFIFAVYALALLSLKDDIVFSQTGEARKTLLARYQGYVEDGLSGCGVTTTHSLTTLRLFLMYICLLFWTGQMLHASSLLGLAFRIAQRMGFHHDPSGFNLSPWDREIRRRMWHFLIHLDTWSMENHGLESVITVLEPTTVELPMNVDDADWNLSEYASVPEAAELYRFTDMTLFLLQSELLMWTRTVLGKARPQEVQGEVHLEHQLETVKTLQHTIEQKYLKGLDTSKLIQRLMRDLTELHLLKMALIPTQPVLLATREQSKTTTDLKVLQLAHEACKMLQNLIDFYTPFDLDWIIVRQFSWHAIATILSAASQNQAPETAALIRDSMQYINQIMSSRTSVDYFAGNQTLWDALKYLQEQSRNTQPNEFQ